MIEFTIRGPVRIHYTCSHGRGRCLVLPVMESEGAQLEN